MQPNPAGSCVSPPPFGLRLKTVSELAPREVA
jgi:hypothetical protein